MSRTDVQLAFDLESYAPGTELTPNWNVAPTQAIPVVVERKPQDDDSWFGDAKPEADVVRALNLAHWGFIPPWAKEPTSNMINARLETVDSKRSFAPGFKKRRCIIPASGYFEWKREGSTKQPYYIFRPDGEPLAFAGLYGWWQTPDAQWLLTATIITREAQGEVAEIHNRTPLILEKHEFDAWLDPSLDNPDEVKALVDRENTDLDFYAVNRAVGNVRHNKPENIDRVEPVI